MYKAKYSGVPVAVKFVKAEELSMDNPELKLMQGLRHPNVVTCYGFSNDKIGYECNTYHH